MIEKFGDDKVYQEKLKNAQSKLFPVVGESKLRNISSSLKLYDKLNPASNVPALLSRKQNSDKRKTIYNDDSKLEKYWNDHKEAIENGKQLKESRKQEAIDPNKTVEYYDLWNDNNNNNESNEAEGVDHDFIPPKPVIRVPEHLRQKPSLLPAVEVPLGGQSYNPDQEQHRDLLVDAANTEAQKIAEEQFWIKKVEKYYVSKEDAPNEQTWIQEMSQGLGLFEHENSDDNKTEIVTDPNEEFVQFTKLVRNEKKTKQQRRRELREKMVRRKKAEEKALRIKENEVYRLKTIKRQLDEHEERIRQRANIRAERHIASMYKPKKLSRHRFVETDLPLNLPNELPDSLRKVKVEGSLLEERFKSLQKRNIIETRVPQTIKRKFKLKKEVKRRHRDDK